LHRQKVTPKDPTPLGQTPQDTPRPEFCNTLVLASKLLFLNNPQTILPFDDYTKKAVGLKENIYAEYKSRLSNFRKQEIEEIKRNLAFIGGYLLVIESEFRDELQDIETVRENRYIDKLLWTIGRAKKNYR